MTKMSYLASLWKRDGGELRKWPIQEPIFLTLSEITSSIELKTVLSIYASQVASVSYLQFFYFFLFLQKQIVSSFMFQNLMFNPTEKSFPHLGWTQKMIKSRF